MATAVTAMSESLLAVRGLVKRFGGVVATNGVSLDIVPNQTHALIGPNGAGKTTLISLIQGECYADSGTIHLAGTEITNRSAHKRAQLGLSRSFQITSVFPQFTALTNVLLAVQAKAGHSFHFWKRADRIEAFRSPALAALTAIGLEDRSDTLASSLSYGELRQLELAMVIAAKPRLLLLDEPMAGMGRRDGLRMTEILQGLKHSFTIFLVEHDMTAVFALADRVSVLVSGQVIATGAPNEIRADPKVRSAYLGNCE
jgi:branched-chain amino acid transport system ATP-binding protein